MLGALRFGLAGLVALSHLPSHYLPLNLGISAVVLFYFTSGFLMYLSYTRFQRQARPALSFYVDRLVRLVPLYVLITLLSFASLLVLGRLREGFSAFDFVLNLMLIPTNYYLDPSFLLIRPSWSLAAEFHFYALVPLLFVIKPNHRPALCVAFSVLHVATFFVSARLSDWGITAALREPYWNDLSALLAYKWPFFVVSIFLMGFLAARDPEDKGSKRALAIMWSIYAGFFFVLGQASGAIAHSVVTEVCLGAVLTLPVVLPVARLKLSATMMDLDRRLGRAAYPFFLVHPICFVWADEITTSLGGSRFSLIITAWLLSVGAAYLLAETIDRRLSGLRYALRGFGRLDLPIR